MIDPPIPASTRFATGDLPPVSRIAAWREHYGRKICRVDIAPLGGSPFECELASQELPDLLLLSAKTSKVRIARTSCLIPDGNDALILLVNETGALAANGSGREIDLKASDAVLISFSDASVFDRHVPGNALSFRIPRRVLSSHVVDVEDRIMRRIPGANGALRLLRGYVGTIARENAFSDADLHSAVAGHIHDLVALSLGVRSEAREAIRMRTLPTARLELAKAYTMANSSRQNLSVEDVAAQLGITSRTVQKLFEREGATFSSFLLEHRLNRAYQILTDPTQNRIGAIAYRVGFGDLSYFNHCFKRRYGATPREIRKDAARRMQKEQ